MGSFWCNQIRLTMVSASLAAVSMCAQAAPLVRTLASPVNVGDTVAFTVYDTQIADAVDPALGIEVIDFALGYAPGTLQYLGAASLLPDAFLSAPDLSVDPDPNGSFHASWVRVADGSTPTDLFTLSFKLLGAPATTLDGTLSLSLPDGGAYGMVGSYAPSSATVSAVPEPESALLALCGVGLLLSLRRRAA